jgi:hypothetical protein
MAEKKVVAVYSAPCDGSWVDLREAMPRARAKSTTTKESPVTVYTDGTVSCDTKAVKIDTYQGEGHKAVREEKVK